MDEVEDELERSFINCNPNKRKRLQKEVEQAQIQEFSEK